MADRFGPRVILTVALAWWSIFTAATGASFGAISLTASRFPFGMGEAAAFPASSRAVVRWLPFEQRGFGQGVQHAGSRLGAAIAPALVVYLLYRTTWRWVFFIFGSVGIILSVIWFWYYRNSPQEHPGVNERVLRMIAPAASQGAQQAGPGPWRQVTHSR